MVVSHVIPSGPRLFQLPAPHPFFNQKIVNMDVLTLGINKTPKAARSGSYMPLQQMMCRSADRLPHHTRTYKTLVSNGAKRVEQVIMDCFEHLKPANGFVPVANSGSTAQETQTKGLGEVGTWLYTRATSLSISSKGSRIAHTDGLGFLVKRAWEMLLGVALIYDEIDTENRKDGRIKGPPAIRQLLLNNKNTSKADKDVWYDARQKGYSSLVIFLLFGVSGWFHCHIDRRRFNPRDIFSLFGIVHQMAHHDHSICRPLKKTSNGEQGDIHVPWEQANNHLVSLLTRSKVGEAKLDWYSAARFWDSELTPANLAPLLLKDFLEEILYRGSSLSSTGELAPKFTFVKFGEEEAWKARAHRILVPHEQYMETYISDKVQRGIFTDGNSRGNKGNDEERSSKVTKNQTK